MIVPSQHRWLHFFMSTAVVAPLALWPSQVHGFDLCDNQIENGEPTGPFFGLEYSLIAHFLAEKFCGAPLLPMSTKFLGYVAERGCGSDTPFIWN